MKPIQPIQYVMNRPETNTLDISTATDNLTSMCALAWTLYVVVITPAVTHTDEDGNVVTDSEEIVTATPVMHGNSIISGDNYVDWSSGGKNVDYCYTYTAEQIGVTLI